ncbi:MAG: cell division protein FtsA [Candidatus Wildermuthbacteria bacterium]|nr:cell division protein FtsA [Candidatus Wildermuthbacteria bacterium]
MPKADLIIGIDIGTQSTKILAVDQNQNEEEGLEIVFRGQLESRGMRKGVVINPAEVSNILQELFLRMNQETDQKADLVHINVGGSHIFDCPSRGLISVSRADQKISGEDVKRVLQEAESVSFPRNNEIFDVITKEFIIDGVRGIKSAEGLQGVKLEAEVLVLGGFAPYLENLNQAVMGSEVQQILDRTPSSMAAARACLTQKQKELGVALVDIGAGTTGLAVFEEGGLIHLKVLPIGSANITNDIAIGLKTDLDTAEKIKIEYGTCISEKKQKREKIESGEGEYLIFSRKQLADIIAPRISEILREINKELRKIFRERLLPAGIVLTGGGCKLPKIIELAKKELKLPVRIGNPQGISGLKDPIWSTCCGLILGGVNPQNGGGQISEAVKGIGARIKKLLKSLIP